MKKITLITAILITANLLSAQWIQQNPYYPVPGFGKTIMNIFFIDQDHGWCVGMDNVSPRGTINGGELWAGMLLFHQYNLNSVFFTDQLHGWAVGDEGEIYHTNDGGLELLSWNEQESSTDFDLTSVFFTDSLKGWVVGHGFGGMTGQSIILKTTDGGDTWVEKYYEIYSGTNGHLYDIFFSDELNGWAVGNKILYTYDGGENWTTINDPELNFTSSSVYFIDTQNGWMTGTIFNGGYHGIIYHTTDGGNNWEQQTDEILGGLYEITFLDSMNGWTVGGLGTILQTTDEGQNWEYQESGTTAGLRSVCFVDENHGWICGDSAIILHTDNGGLTGFKSYVQNSKFEVRCFPNPVSDDLTVEFELDQTIHVSIQIYNCIGDLLIEPKSMLYSTGQHQVNLNLIDLKEGIYFCTIKIGNEMETKKIIKTK